MTIGKIGWVAGRSARIKKKSPTSIEVGEAVLKHVPGDNFGEAEKDDPCEDLSGFVAVETDREAATPAVEVGRGHVIVVGLGFHSANN